MGRSPASRRDYRHNASLALVKRLASERRIRHGIAGHASHHELLQCRWLVRCRSRCQKPFCRGRRADGRVWAGHNPRDFILAIIRGSTLLPSTALTETGRADYTDGPVTGEFRVLPAKAAPMASDQPSYHGPVTAELTRPPANSRPAFCQR
jgi:hypothetical protein